MQRLLRSLFGGKTEQDVQRINSIRAMLAEFTSHDLKTFARSTKDKLEIIAAAATAASYLLGLEMFDAQIRGTLALIDGHIAEMQTGEGKTLAAAPAVIWLAKMGNGVHVLTLNDHLARRDARWMGGIYEFFGLSVSFIQSEMTREERQQAYRCDITYASAKEVGFDYLRDQVALYPQEQVHRPFAVALIDDADSILLDEARVPQVIACAKNAVPSLPYHVNDVVRHFQCGTHYAVEEYGQCVMLTDAGVHAVEQAFGCKLDVPENRDLHAAVQDSLHAHVLLRRDVNYRVKDGWIEFVNELSGLADADHYWPPALRSAVEAKEGITPQEQATVLVSITLQNLIAEYPQVCGMSGSAATQAEELRSLYALEVEVVPANRPTVRVDQPYVLFETKQEKEAAVIDEIMRTHAIGRPILVGTTSMEESERLSQMLGTIPHQVLRARNYEDESGIVAYAGQRGAVTICTNMAGRGTDIRLGPGVADMGGMHVIGLNKNESRRIDHQLRSRAGRQGDPGSSQFFVSLEDDLLVRYSSDDPELGRDPDAVQRVVEAQNLAARQLLNKYESVIDAQRQALQKKRQDILTGTETCSSEIERLARLTAIDNLWAELLIEITAYRADIDWLCCEGDPLQAYLTNTNRMFCELLDRIEAEVQRLLTEAETSGIAMHQRDTMWTYVATDEFFQAAREQVIRSTAKEKLVEQPKEEHAGWNPTAPRLLTLSLAPDAPHEHAG